MGDAEEAEERRRAELSKSFLDLALAWGLVMICCTHHVGHAFHAMGLHQFAHTPLMTFMSQPAVSAALGAFALLGPGRKIIVDGAKSFIGYAALES